MAHETFFTEPKLTFNGEKINARISWNADNREWLVEVLASGMALVEYTDTAAKLNNACLSADDMVNEYIQRVFKEYGSNPTAQPAEVDMGGDFEGFIEAVNAEPEPAAQLETIAEYTNVDKDVDAGVRVSPTDGRYYAFVSVNGSVVDNELFDDKYPAMQWAKTWFEQYTAPTTAAEQPKPENVRIRQLREKIARNERELVSLRFELEQALSDL